MTRVYGSNGAGNIKKIGDRMNFGDFDEHADQNLNLFTKAIPTSTKNYSKSKNTLALFVFLLKNTH